MIDYTAIGKRIRGARKAQGLTQERLAELSGIEPSNISHIERAATKLSLPTLVAIANSLGVTTDELLYESLLKNTHVSVKQIDELLSDCTPDELRSIVELIQTTKSILRSR